MPSRCSKFASLLVLVLFLIPQQAAGQSFRLPTDPSDHPVVALETYKPFFDDVAGNISLLSSAYYLAGHVPLFGDFGLVADLPFAYFGAKNVYGDDHSEAAFGNPYLGIVRRGASGESYELGVRLPVLNDAFDAASTGLAADLDRLEAFFPQAFAVTARSNQVRHIKPASLRVRLRTGFTTVIPSERRESGELALVLDYGLNGTFTPGRLVAGGGVTGRLAVTGSGGFADRIFHQMELNVGRRYGRFTPVFVLRAPLDAQFNDFVSGIVGLQLGISFD